MRERAVYSEAEIVEIIEKQSDFEQQRIFNGLTNNLKGEIFHFNFLKQYCDNHPHFQLPIGRPSKNHVTTFTTK